MTSQARKAYKAVVMHIVNGEMRFLDLAELGVEAVNEIEAFYEFRGKGEKLSSELKKTRNIFARTYRTLRKLYYNV
jgi:hypothetical protein